MAFRVKREIGPQPDFPPVDETTSWKRIVWNSIQLIVWAFVALTSAGAFHSGRQAKVEAEQAAANSQAAAESSLRAVERSEENGHRISKVGARVEALHNAKKNPFDSE